MITSWSPSRLEKYNSCARKAKYEIVLKLCRMCFKGKLMGGFGTPVICDTCGQTVEVPAPLKRGSEIGKNLELYVKGEADEIHEEIRHPKVQTVAKKLRSAFMKKKVLVEHDIILDRNWRPVKGWDKGAWLRTKLDILQINAKKTFTVIDWKTGGCDKRTGEVRASAKYDDQLSIYNTATLSAFAGAQAVASSLIFTDCGPRFPPDIVGPKLVVADLPKAQAHWEKKAKPLLADTVFAPRPGDACRFCSFRKELSGPCPY